MACDATRGICVKASLEVTGMENAKSSLSAAPTMRWRVRLFPLSLVALLPLLAFAGFTSITALDAYRSVDNARL
jgi:hypothetical protein